jgi:NADPH:quinone reductase-like Zn-dependent oxidoreductase
VKFSCPYGRLDAVHASVDFVGSPPHHSLLLQSIHDSGYVPRSDSEELGHVGLARAPPVHHEVQSEVVQGEEPQGPLSASGRERTRQDPSHEPKRLFDEFLAIGTTLRHGGTHRRICQEPIVQYNLLDNYLLDMHIVVARIATVKAAVLHALGETPRYEDFPDPQPGSGEVVVKPRAVAVDNAIRVMVAGSHFASRQFLSELPGVVGFGGIGQLADGRLVGFGGVRPPYGTMAETAVVPEGSYHLVPDGVDPDQAAAIPSSTMTSLVPLRWGSKLNLDDTVLVHGATGFAGRLAVQVAKLLGVKRVVGTGRDPAGLAGLASLGADGVVDLGQPDSAVLESLARESGSQGYGVILDYLWGHPTEIILRALSPKRLAPVKKDIRLIQIGESAGPIVSLRADAVRTSGLQIQGATAAFPAEAMGEAIAQVWEWMKAGKLTAEIERIPLPKVEQAWKRTELHGKRVVLTI